MAIVGTCSTHSLLMTKNKVDNVDFPGPSELKEIKSPNVIQQQKKRVRFLVPESPKIDTCVMEELEEVMEAWETGVAYIIGQTHMRAKSGSNMLKKIGINSSGFSCM